MQGIITKIIENKGFFFIDNDYKCFFDKVSFSPQVLARVEYERDKDKNGKSIARNVKLISSATTNSNASGTEFFHLYLEDLAKGYFEKENYIREEFIAGHAKKLAGFFESNRLKKD